MMKMKINLNPVRITEQLHYYPYPVSRQDVNSLCMIIKTGSIHEQKQEHGISHLIEHLIVSYIKNKFNSRLLGMPSSIWGYTNFEETVIGISAKRLSIKKIYTIFEYLLKLIFNKIPFSTAVLESEKKKIIKEIEDWNSSINFSILNHLLAESPNKRVPIGNPEIVRDITVSHIQHCLNIRHSVMPMGFCIIHPDAHSLTDQIRKIYIYYTGSVQWKQVMKFINKKNKIKITGSNPIFINENNRNEQILRLYLKENSSYQDYGKNINIHFFINVLIFRISELKIKNFKLDYQEIRFPDYQIYYELVFRLKRQQGINSGLLYLIKKILMELLQNGINNKEFKQAYALYIKKIKKELHGDNKNTVILYFFLNTYLHNYIFKSPNEIMKILIKKLKTISLDIVNVYIMQTAEVLLHQYLDI